MVKTIKNIFLEASGLNDYLSSRGINPKFVSRDTKISHAKSAEFQKWKNDRKMTEETVSESSETELLAKYLSSRGINAKYATKDMKIAHSKSGQFLKWKRDHMHDELNEETDKKDMICMDIPLLIRVLEFTREDMKSDIQLHNMVERLINMRDNVPLDMTHYDAITSNLVKEEILDEAKKPKTTALEKWRKSADEREKKHNQTKTKGMEDAITKLSQHLNKENTLDSMAATEAPCDCSDNTNSMPTTGKSYAAKMVKDLKKKTVKEETYDWEKDDKLSMAKPYGKPPKVDKIDKTGNAGDTKPEARVVMKGGTTLTGQPRDMVEIDPSMKQRPGQEKGQDTFTKEYTKKSPS
jgi:hypothetical protein